MKAKLSYAFLVAYHVVSVVFLGWLFAGFVEIGVEGRWEYFRSGQSFAFFGHSGHGASYDLFFALAMSCAGVLCVVQLFSATRALRLRGMRSFDMQAPCVILACTPIYGLWFYRRKLLHPAPAVSEVTDRGRRKLLDAGFVAMILATGVFFVSVLIGIRGISGDWVQIAGTTFFIMTFLVVGLHFLSCGWCLLKIDYLDKDWRKPLWQLTAIMLPLIGPSLCYFLHLRGRDLEDRLSFHGAITMEPAGSGAELN